jgi:cytochrome c2
MRVSLLLVVCIAAACGGERDADAAGDTSVPATQSASDPRAALFIAKGCPQCHSISALGVTSPTEVGPDLTHAATDVRSRFNTTLEEFLASPTGTMQIVLSAQIQLSAAERDAIVRILHSLSDSL